MTAYLNWSGEIEDEARGHIAHGPEGYVIVSDVFHRSFAPIELIFSLQLQLPEPVVGVIGRTLLIRDVVTLVGHTAFLAIVAWPFAAAL